MTLNPEVTVFLDGLNHPLRPVIEALRRLILNAEPALDESVKWNAPSYSLAGRDLITLKLMPPRQIQVIFHTGVQKIQPLAKPLITDPEGMLSWRGNERAFTGFSSEEAVRTQEVALAGILRNWLAAAKEL